MLNLESKKNTKKGAFLFGSLILLSLIIVWFITPGKYDNFVNCLNEKGVKIYGSNMCLNCQNQKALFGKSFRKVDYTNCDFNKETCINELIYGLPTWKIDNKRLVGTQSLETLASETGCRLQ